MTDKRSKLDERQKLGPPQIGRMVTKPVVTKPVTTRVPVTTERVTKAKAVLASAEKAPKRDRAAYMANYRNKQKGKPNG